MLGILVIDITDIEDTGIGISQSTVDSLFTYNVNHSAQGTAGESSGVMGDSCVLSTKRKLLETFASLQSFGLATPSRNLKLPMRYKKLNPLKPDSRFGNNPPTPTALHQPKTNY